MYGWKSSPDLPIRDAFKRQKEHVLTEFEQRSSQVWVGASTAEEGCIRWSGRVLSLGDGLASMPGMTPMARVSCTCHE